MSDVRLESLLRGAGARLELPAEPDLVAIVHARIAASPSKRRPRLGPVVWTRRSLALAAALTIAAASVAVASYYGVRGVRIRVGPTPTPTAGVGGTFDLGA